jgi:hypothetical protein
LQVAGVNQGYLTGEGKLEQRLVMLLYLVKLVPRSSPVDAELITSA